MVVGVHHSLFVGVTPTPLRRDEPLNRIYTVKVHILRQELQPLRKAFQSAISIAFSLQVPHYLEYPFTRNNGVHAEWTGRDLNP